MQSLSLVWALASLVISAAGGTGAALCREIMLDQVQRRMPEGQKIRYPYLSWKYAEIIRLHEKYYPDSDVRAVSRFLTHAALITMGTLGLYMLGSVILRPILK